MDRSQRLLEVEVIVLLFGRDTNIAARRQTPVVYLDLGAVDELHQSLDIPKRCIGEAFLQPVGLSDEVPRTPQHFDRSGTCALQSLARLVDVWIGPERRVPRLQFFRGYVDHAPGQLQQEYFRKRIRAARARGLSQSRVIYRHAVRSIIPAMVNISGLQVGFIFGSALFAEVIFQWPGVGLLMYNSILGRDVPVIQAVLLVIALVFIIVNLISDITIAALNPQVRRGGR